MLRTLLLMLTLVACTDQAPAKHVRPPSRVTVLPMMAISAPVPVTPEEPTELLLARILVSEAGWDNRPDGTAIWAVARSVRSRSCDNGRLAYLDPSKQISSCWLGSRLVRPEPGTTIEGARETQQSALRRLSRRATGTIDADGRHRWIANLEPGGEAPAGWIECPADGCDGTWSNYRALWSDTLEFATRLVKTRPIRVCDRGDELGPPIAWGNAQDHWMAEQRGLAPIWCGATQNWFYARPRQPT